jgi:hypothetical protein
MQILYPDIRIIKEVCGTSSIFKIVNLQRPIEIWGRDKMANGGILRPMAWHKWWRKSVKNIAGKTIHFADTNYGGWLIPPRQSYYPGINSAFFEQLANANWQEYGNSVSGYQNHRGSIRNFQYFQNLEFTTSNRAMGRDKMANYGILRPIAWQKWRPKSVKNIAGMKIHFADTSNRARLIPPRLF